MPNLNCLNVIGGRRDRQFQLLDTWRIWVTSNGLARCPPTSEVITALFCKKVNQDRNNYIQHRSHENVYGNVRRTVEMFPEGSIGIYYISQNKT